MVDPRTLSDQILKVPAFILEEGQLLGILSLDCVTWFGLKFLVPLTYPHNTPVPLQANFMLVSPAPTHVDWLSHPD